MSRSFLALLLFLSAVPGWAQKSEEEAGDVSEVEKDATGPLRDRIQPVSGHLFLMDGRFELSPALGLSFRDAFFTKVMFGAALTYHFTETFAASLRGAYMLSLVSGSAQLCTQPGSQSGRPAECHAPTMTQLTQDADGTARNKAYGLMTFLGTIDLEWAPLYGKVALFAENVLYFNMYGLAGPALVVYGPSAAVTVGGNLGLGFRFAINRWLAVRLELRDTLYNEVGWPEVVVRDADGRVVKKSDGTPQTEAPQSLRNQLTAELGLSFFFPTTFAER